MYLMYSGIYRSTRAESKSAKRISPSRSP